MNITFEQLELIQEIQKNDYTDSVKNLQRLAVYLNKDIDEILDIDTNKISEHIKEFNESEKIDETLKLSFEINGEIFNLINSWDQTNMYLFNEINYTTKSTEVTASRQLFTLCTFNIETARFNEKFKKEFNRRFELFKGVKMDVFKPYLEFNQEKKRTC
jgi:hypothetical protein